MHTTVATAASMTFSKGTFVVVLVYGWILRQGNSQSGSGQSKLILVVRCCIKTKWVVVTDW